MSLDQPDTLEQQRREADRRYNDALTAFDAALVRANPEEPAGLVADAVLPPVPEGWQAWSLRAVSRWLTPWMEQQQTFNARAANAIETLINRDRERAVAFGDFQAALIAFLQQITAFVETKDRQLAATATARFEDQQRQIRERHQEFLDAMPELHAQIAVLQRATHMLKRRLTEPVADQPQAPAAPTASAAPAASGTESVDDYKYVGFEDQFRGSDESVAEKLAEYLPLFAGARDVVDLGCGRGEFLLALKGAGVTARGVDTNAEMVAVARERGLDVTRVDALTYLTGLADESIGGLIAAQVVEHLEPSYLTGLLDAASRTMRPGSPIVLETINPACWYAFFSSYIRDITHVQPVHPETLQYLVRASGFTRVEIRYRAPLPDHVKLDTVALPDAIRHSHEHPAPTLTTLADTVSANAVKLNKLLFSYMDYAVVGYRS